MCQVYGIFVLVLWIDYSILKRSYKPEKELNLEGEKWLLIFHGLLMLKDQRKSQKKKDEKNPGW